MDIISYILSRKYTDMSIVGLGSIRGANCTIKDIVHQDGINTVTFEWTGTDGTKKTRDMVVEDGTPIYVWESGNTYHYGDLAIYESQFYRCIVENSDVTFDDTKWNEIGSPDGNYDIVQSRALLPARFTAADRKLYFVIDECIFYLWDGTQWVALNHMVQETSFPTAAPKYLGKVYQYIGVTDVNFVHGLVYECVSDGQTPATYSWQELATTRVETATQNTLGIVKGGKGVTINNEGGIDVDVNEFLGTQAQWDNLTTAQQNAYDIVNIIDDNQNIDLSVYLRKVQTMPLASECPSETVIYVGATTADYTKGYVYRSTPTTQSGTTVYNWVRQDVQPYIQADYAQNDTTAHDYIKNKPNLGTASEKDYTSNVRPNNFDLVESHAVYSAINSALSSIYVPRGDLSCAELTADLLIPANVGNVYTMSDSGTTSALFINGAGHPIAVNDNVGIIRAGADSIMFNLMGNAFDLHDYQTKELETPLTIDGTEETTVEGALGELNDSKVSYKYNGEMGAKNLIPYPYLATSCTIGGMTITDNGDGTLTVDGTATTDLYFNLSNQDFGDVALTDPRSQYVLTDGFAHTSQFYVGYNAKNKITSLNILTGVIADNVTVYPMIRLASDTDSTWQPYAKTNYELTQDVNNLPIRSGTGNKSAIIGDSNNTVTSAYGFAGGSGSTSTGNSAVAIGIGARATGSASFAEGQSTNANAFASHAEGYHTSANGSYSHSQGMQTSASGMSQTVIGKYNVLQGQAGYISPTDYALIIGNGEANNRSNALAVQWDGTVVMQDGSTMKSAKTVYYVSTSGNDNNNGTQSSPLATVDKALELGADVIYLEGGRYFQQIDLSKTNKSKVKISNISANTRVIFTDADRKLATSATQTSGYTRIYQFPCNITFDDNNKWIFQEDVADINTLIDDNDRLPSQRGYKYRCYSTKIVKCQSTTLSDALNEIENAEENEYKWYLDNGILYCSCRNEIGSDTPISYSLGKTLFLHPNKNTSVELIGISCQFIGINITDMINPQVIDCQVFNYYGSGGIEYSRSIDANIVRCEIAHIFSGSVGDGINAHGQTGGGPVAHNVTATITDCWSHDNNDDGFSDHECCESVIIGGLYEHNGKAGITPSYGSHCTCRNVISRNNYNGFYYFGEASQAEQGQYGQLLCIDCVSESNIYGDRQAHAGYLSAGNGNRVTLVNCKSLNNRYGYYASSGTSMRMIDCTSYDTQFKVGSGTFSITSVIDDINTTLNTKLDKVSSLPTPSSTYLDKVYLLTSTQTGYQKGGIYQCVSDGASTPTYSWQLISSADMVEFTAQELLAMW